MDSTFFASCKIPSYVAHNPKYSYSWQPKNDLSALTFTPASARQQNMFKFNETIVPVILGFQEHVVQVCLDVFKIVE